LLTLGIVVIGAVSFAGCGSDSSAAPYVEPTGPPIKTVTVSAKNFSFTPNTLESPAGIIQIDLKSADGIHDLVIEGIPGFRIEVTSGNSSSAKVKLQPGKYTFYCSLPGHRSGGMEGTLTVT
jgi:Copper binding proteins, plastocyanin/azurin family.